MRLKNNTKKVLLGSLAALACGSVAFGVSAINAVNASAADVPFYSDGAAVYITDSVEDAKVRFNATMTESFYATYFTEGKPNAGVETGILVVPYDVYLGKGVEKLDLTTYETCEAQRVETTYLWEENNGVMEAYAVLTGKDVPVASHNRVLYYVCYAATIDGETVTNEAYTAARKTSMSYVAMKSQDDIDLTDTQKADLKSTYMHEYEVKFNDAYARTETMTYGDKLTANTSNALENLYWDANYTDPVKATDYVTCADEVYVKEQNTAELMSYNYKSDTTEGTRQDNSSTSEYNIDWLPNFSGKDGVMQVEYTGSTKWAPKFTVYPRQSIKEDSTIYNEYAYLVIDMYIVLDDTYTSDWEYVAVGSSSASGLKYTLTEDDYNTWLEVKVRLIDLKAIAPKNLMVYGECDDTTAQGKFYVADVRLEKIETIELNSETFGTYVSKKYTGGADLVWNESAQAVQVDLDGDSTTTVDKYPGFKMQNLWDYDVATALGYDYFTVDIYIVKESDPYDSTYVPETTMTGSYLSVTKPDKIRLMKVGQGLSSGAYDAGNWNTYIIPVESLQANYFEIWGALGTMYGKARMYVKGLSLCKSDLDVEVTGENGLVTGEALTVSVTENGNPITSYKSGYAVREGNGSNTQIKSGSVTITVADTWYVIVTTEDGKVGMTKITVTAPTTA